MILFRVKPPVKDIWLATLAEQRKLRKIGRAIQWQELFPHQALDESFEGKIDPGRIVIALELGAKLSIKLTVAKRHASERKIVGCTVEGMSLQTAQEQRIILNLSLMHDLILQLLHNGWLHASQSDAIRRQMRSPF